MVEETGIFSLLERAAHKIWAVSLLALILGVGVSHSSLAQSATDTPAAASQTAGQAVGALANVPGLKNLTVSNVQTDPNSNITTASVSLKGVPSTLIGFSVGNNPAAAIIPQQFELKTFVPVPSGTPFDSVSFSNMAFIVVGQGGGASGVQTSGLPNALSAALSGAGDKIDLKPGINLFGGGSVSGGAIGDLLTATGAATVNLPLNTVLPSDLFAYDANASGDDAQAASENILSQVLDTLQFQSEVPSLDLKGLPGAKSFKDGVLGIKSSKNTQGDYIYDVIITGALDVSLKDSDAPFAVELKLDQVSPTQSELTITGSAQKDIKISLFRPFDIKQMAITAKRQQTKWDVTVNGKSKINNKDIDVAVHIAAGQSASAQPIYDIAIPTPLQVSDIIPALNMPGFSDVALENLIVRNNTADARIKIRNAQADIVYYRTAPNAKAQIAVLPDSFALPNFIPPLVGTPLDGATFDNMAVIWVPQGEAKTGVAVSGLEPTVAQKLSAAGASLDFKEGLNLFGSADFPSSGEIGSLLTQVGMSDLKLPIRGTIDPAVFRSGGGQVTNAVLDNLDLNLPLPALKPAGMPGFVTFAGNGFLHFDGSNTNGTRSFRFQVKDGLSFSVAGKKATFDGSFMLRKTGQQSAITLTGNTKDTLSFPGFTNFESKTLSLNATKKGNVWGLNLAATADLNSKELDLTAALSTGGSGGGAAYDVVIDTQLTLADFIGGGFNAPGLSEIELEKLEITKAWAETRIKVRSEEANIAFYRSTPSAKMQIAVMPDAFTLATFIPPLAGTPLDSGAFSNMAFIWVPQGEASATAPTGVPADVDKVLKASAQAHAFKEGLNLYGTFAATSSGQVGSLLSSLGVTNHTLPLSGSLNPSLFSKGAESAQIKQAILNNLDISAPLPVPKIPGAPAALTFKNAHFSVSTKENNGTREVDVAVNGAIDVKLASKEVAFTFDVAAAKTAGTQSELTITADSTSKVTLPFFQPLELDAMSLTAVRKDGKWASRVDAKSKINNKPLDVVATKTADGNDTVKITTKITLADLLPSGTSIPGLSDVEFNEVDFYTGFGEFTGKLKGLDTQVTAFKRGPGNKLHIGATFGDFTVGSFVPQVSGSALDDATFDAMAFVWVPSGDGEKGVQASTLPNDLGAVISKSSATVDLNPGLNLKGSLVIKQGTKIGSLLSKIGIKSNSLPLTGSLSSQVFAKGTPSGSAKNAILDALDISAPVPLPKMQDVPVSFKNAHFAIKGENKGGTRDILVAVTGDVDVKLGTKEVDFAFDIAAGKKAGGGTDVTITANSTSKVTLPFFQPLELDAMSLTATRKDGKWSSYVDAKSKLNNKDLEVVVTRKPNPGEIVKITTKITLADLLPSGTSIPGLSDVEFDEIDFYENYGQFTGKLKGLDTQVTAFKRGPGNRLHIGVTFGDFTVGSFIPQVSGSALDDATFDSMAFVWVPQGTGEKGVKASDLPNDLGTVITKSSSTIDLNPGLNLKGSLVIKQGTKVGSLLSKTGIKSNSLPLTGTLSPQVFAKGTPSGGVKNAILDALNISAPVPLPSMPGVPVTFKKTHFAIKGENKGGTRDILVAVTGDIDVKLGSKDIDFAFDIEADKTVGGGTDVTITAESTSKVTLPFFQPLELDAMKLTATRKGGKWDSFVDATSKLNNKPLEVVATKTTDGNDTVKITTKITLADLLPSGTSIPGLSDVEFDEIDFYKGFGEFTGKIKNLDTQVTAFKRGPGNKLHIGVTFGDFTVGSFIPQVSGSALDDASFDNMAFVWVPKGDGEKGVQASDLPNDLGTVITKSSATLDLNPGLNVKGSLVVKQGTKIGSLLTKVNIKSNSLPLTGTLSPQVFAKGAPSGGVKNAIIDALDISAPVPLPSMSGAPVTFKKAHFAIKGEKKGETRDILVAVTGEIDVKVGSKEIDFAFDIEADKTVGGGTDLTITADTTKKVTLNLFEPMELDSMNLTATRKSGKWASHVDAKTKLNNKEVDVVVTKEEKDESVKITSKITLADLMPSGSSVPGLSDVEIDEVDILPGYVEAQLKIKGMDTIVTAFKHGGKKYMATNIVKDFDIGSFIPAVNGTPLDDAKFEHMVFVWAPKTGAASNLKPTDLPKSIGDPVKVTAETFAFKPGVNVFGQMVIAKESKVGKLLSAVKINKDSLPLKGALPTAIFGKVKGGTATIKNEILDSLNLNIPLPNISLPGMPNVVKIQHTNLSIKGKNDKGSRSLDVAVTGRLDVSHGSSKADFDFDIEVVRKSGVNKLLFSAAQLGGESLTVSLLEPLTLTNMTFGMDNYKPAGWTMWITASATFHNNSVRLTYTRDPGNKISAAVTTKGLKLSQLFDSPGLPGLDDVELDYIGIMPERLFVHGKVKGTVAYLEVQKPKSGSGHLVAAYLYSMALTDLIPGSENTPLKDVNFSNVVALYNPSKQATTLATMDMKGDTGSWIAQSNSNPTIKPGMNIFGHMDVKPGGEMKTLLSKAGISEVKLPLNGKFSPKAFAKNLSAAAIKNEILDNLDIKMNLPTPNIPEVSKFLTFKNGHLRVRGKTPSGARGLDVGISGDTVVGVKSDKLDFFMDVEYESPQGSTDKEWKFTGKTEKPWNHPVGIHWLDLDTLSIGIDEKKKGGSSTFDIKVKAKTKVGSSSEMDVVVDVHEKNGSITDAYFEMDGPIKLGDIPEINRIPEASKFTLTKLIVSEHGIEADSIIGGRATDLFAFHGSGWNLALTQKNFAITELIPPLKNTPLKHISFPFAAVMLSEAGLNKPYNQLSKVGQDALKDIYSNPGERINIKPGVAFVAGFHPDHAGAMGKTVKGLGVKSEVLVMGEVSGIFGGGTPMVTLKGILSEGGSNSLPPFMKMSKSVNLAFFLTADEDEFDLGIEVDVNTKIKSDTLLFDTKVQVQVLDDGFGLEVIGQMQGMWHKPFGIPGFSLGNVTMEFGTEDGGLKLGFGGETVIANDTFTMAGDVVISEALVPEAVAFKASATEIPMDFVEEVALNILAKKIHFDLPPSITPTFKGVKAAPARNGYPATKGTKGVEFAFVSPGAQDASLGLTSEGFGLHGSLNWLGHELGEMKLSVSPQSGIYAQAKIDDFKMGPIDLEDNQFLLEASPTKIPLLKINSQIDVLGIKEKFDVVFDSTEIKIHAKGSISPDITADFEMDLTGLDLSKAKIDIAKADFFLKGDFTLDIQKFIEGPAKKAMEEAFDEMGKGLKSGLVALKKAQKKVDGLTTKINEERAKVRRERAAAERRLQSAENRVNGLNREIDHEWHKYHHCHGWSKGICKARWGLAARATEAVRDIADEALRLAETLVAHFPIDLDPRVAFYITERDTAKAALYVAEKAVEGLQDLDSIMKRALDVLADALGKAADINIKKADFKGDLRGVITKDEPVELGLDADLFGLNVNEQFSFKIKDIAYDVEQLGLIGLYALDHLFESFMHDLPKGFRGHAHAVIGRKIEAKQASQKQELAKYGKDFKGFNKQGAAITARYKAFNNAYLKEQVAIKTSSLDHDPVSLKLNNEYIEVGHTGLCLANQGGHIVQLPCNNKDAANQKWSTRPAFGADSIPESRGYVFLYQQAGGACVSMEGKWTTVQKKFDNFDFPFPVFKGDNKLKVSGCVNATEYYWKVIKHGDGWMQLANRANSHCLHFYDSNGIPSQAKAEWAPCVGSANQVFRVADSTSPKYHKAGVAFRSDTSGLCFGNAAKEDAPVHLVNCLGGNVALYDYLVDIEGRIKIVNTRTGRCLQPHNYKTGVNLSEAVCTQLDYQWWGAIQVPGGWKIKNAQTTFCTEQEYWVKGAPVAQGSCENWSLNVFAPTAAYRNGTYWKGSSFAQSIPLHSKFDAAYTVAERMPAYTLKKHAEERAQIGRLRNDANWAARNIHNGCTPTQNSELAYWKRSKRDAHGWGKWAEIARADAEIAWLDAQCRAHEAAEARNAANMRARIRGDDYNIAVMQRRLSQNFTPAPEPKWYICRGYNGYHQAWVPGVVVNRKCVYSAPFEGTIIREPVYDILTETIGVGWVKNVGGHLPANAIPTGFWQKPWPATAYSCRTMVDDKTKIGWTWKGQYCRYNHLGTYALASNFEVLSRDAYTVYTLDLTN